MFFWGIETSKAMKAYLRLPDKFNIPEEVDLKKAELQTEVTAIKQCYSRKNEEG